MESNRTATLLSAFSLGLIGLCFALLLHEVVITRQLWGEIPRLFASFLAPVPLAIFIAWCFANRAGDAPAEPSPIGTSLSLALAVAVTIGISILFRDAFMGDDSSVAPAMAEAAVFSASLLNFLIFRSPAVAAVLSGMSIGLTVFVIFLT